jgi:hypothetical protein
MSKKVLVAVVVVGALWVLRSTLQDSGPLSDGLYFTFEWGGSTITVTFHDAGRNRYRAQVEGVSGSDTVPAGGDGDVVTARMRTTDGRIFEVASFGPFWIPPGEVEVGGSAYGSRIGEVRSWRGWNVGVVTAAVGGGALRGTWYYEETTGFLVGGNRGTAVTVGDGNGWALTATNHPTLSIR